MLQATFRKRDGLLDWYNNTGSAVVCGQVVVVGLIVGIVNGLRGIAAGEWGTLAIDGHADFVKSTGALAVGDSIYWHTTADPVSGTAGTGAANGTASGGTLIGVCEVAALSGDATVRVAMTSAQRTPPRFPTATVAAAGSAQGDAAAVVEGFTLVTGADATKGVILPAAEAGKQVIIKNADAANAILKIYPATGGAINALAANGAFSIAAKTSVLLIAYDATTWYSLPLLPS